MIHEGTKIDYNRKKGKTAAAKKGKKKNPVKKTQTTEIKKSIKQRVNEKISEMGLFELATSPYAYNLIFNELERRIKLIQTLLNETKLVDALVVVNNLLKTPQETRS